MNKIIKIGNKRMGYRRPCLIIAEAGVNHNGSFTKAKKLIDMAVNSGADIVKFQTFKTEKIVIRTAARAKYQEKNMPDTKETQSEMLKKLELKNTDFKKLKDYAQTKKIIFLSTPYDFESIDFLDSIGVPAFKVSSAWITNLPFLKYLAKKRKPIIFSRGMSNEDEIIEAIKTMKGAGNNKLILLHCHFNYPTDGADANLKVIKTLKEKFKLPVGFSDHTLGIEASLAAVALGAKVIEKHFTLDKTMKGPDHKASLEPNEFEKMVQAIRLVEKFLGSNKIKITKHEAPMRQVSRTSIVSLDSISAGEKLTDKNIGIKRPGTGIQPKHFHELLGKKVKISIPADKIIKPKWIYNINTIKKLTVGNKL